MTRPPHDRLSTPGDKSRQPAPTRPSATLVLLRDGAAGLEVLLLRRGQQLAAFAGAWVFPGGVTEARDHGGTESLTISAARQTAARELREETGLEINAEMLVPLSRWITPETMPRRFDTWFFLAEAPADEVRIDRQEIHAHCWASPAKALKDHRAGRMVLVPPTWVTLYHLTAFKRCETAMDFAARHTPRYFAPRVVQKNPNTCFLYGGDAAYDNLDLETPGPRHRLWVCSGGWHYEQSPLPRVAG